jgi:glycosyltransferase involved in cell wall biosynthesis
MSVDAMPLLSIVIPCYNRPHYLRQCLQSIAERAAPDWEVLIVDDGSTVSIRAVVEEFATLTRYVRQPNSGLGTARNTGVRETTGRYIKFLDDDDLLLSTEVLMKQLALLEQHQDIGLVHAQAVKIDATGRERGIFQPSWTNESYIHSGEVEIERLLVQNYIVPSTAVIRREVFADGTLFRTYPTAQDWDCWIRIARHWSVAYVAEPAAAYRMHADTISARKTEEVVIQVREDVLRDLFADDAFARRYSHLLGPIHAHLDVMVASVAHGRRRPRSCMRYASRGVVRSVRYRRWGDAREASGYLLKSLIPLPLRDYRRRLQSRRRLPAGRVPGSIIES